MTLQLGALRDALLEAGASQAKADEASEELAGYEGRLAGIESKLSTLTWIGTINIALTVAGFGLMLNGFALVLRAIH